MKRVLLLSALFGLQIVLKAQKVYFIYLQSESSAPFYVKMDGKIQSSTTEGYLIIPKLTDSTYLVAIGQPGKQSEPKFSITISRGDRGFLIKDFDGTPGLFDLQTLAVYKPIAVDSSTTQTVAKNDNFTKLLAKAADDTTLLTEPVVVQEQKIKAKEPKVEVVAVKEEVVAVKNIPAKDTIIQQSSSATLATDNASSGIDQKDTVTGKIPQVIPEPEKDVVINKKDVVVNKKEETATAIKEEYQKSLITKKPGGYTPDGVGFVFFDNYDGKVDTVQLVIPNPNPNIASSETTEKQATETRQFLEISDKKGEASKKDTLELKTVESFKAKLKPQCRTLSTDDDFFKLRKDMVSKKSDDEMIAQAKKYLRAKCFRTEQIKYLSSLFLSDEGKYQFFDAAYLHVSDQERFGSLQSELKDSYYINRFKALLGN